MNKIIEIKRILRIVIFACVFAAFPGVQALAADGWPDGVQGNGIPAMVLSIDEQEFENVVNSPDHSYSAETGSIKIYVPDGYTSEYTGEVLADSKDLSLEYIRGRGHSSWYPPKKPFKIKLDKSQDLLGMGKNKHWVLLANAFDSSLIRNRLVGYMGRELGLDYTPKYVLVDFYVNDQYYGNFLLAQQVRIHETRVDIPELTGDRVFTAKYVSEEEAILPSGLYFPEQVKWCSLEDSTHYYLGREYMITPEIVDDDTIHWTSSDESVAYLDDDFVMFKKAGTTVITGTTRSGVKNSFTLHIINEDVDGDIEDFSFAQGHMALKPGEYGQNVITFAPADKPFSTSMTYTSSDESIATINEMGVVEAKKEGVCTITAADYWSDVEKSYTLTVTTEQAASPVFDPEPGTYTKAQNVTISCETAGADIYYTTDGSRPTTDEDKERQPAATKTSIKGAEVSGIKAKTWTGKARKQSLTVKLSGKTLMGGKDYTVIYRNNKNVGKAALTIKGKGSYTGTITKIFKINPKGTKIKKLTKAKKAVTVKWYKQSKKMSKSRITGYRIQLATNKKFTRNKKTVTVKGCSRTSKRVTGLKGRKKYYIRIRTYKKVGGKKYFSRWSKVKAVRTR